MNNFGKSLVFAKYGLVVICGTAPNRVNSGKVERLDHFGNFRDARQLETDKFNCVDRCTSACQHADKRCKVEAWNDFGDGWDIGCLARALRRIRCQQFDLTGLDKTCQRRQCRKQHVHLTANQCGNGLAAAFEWHMREIQA